MSIPTSGSLYTTNTPTPTGQPMQVAVDNPYVTKEQFIKSPMAKGFGITATSDIYTSGELDNLLLQASGYVNRYTRRYFDRQQIDEIYPNVTIQVMNPQLTTVPLQYGPIHNVQSMFIQILQWFTEFSLEYLQIQPLNHYVQIVPMLSSDGSTGIPIPSVLLQQANLGKIWTKYDFGYFRSVTGATGAITTGTTYKFTESGASTNTQLWCAYPEPVIKVNGVEVSSSIYTINYRDGLVTFNTSQGANPVTADFATYDKALPPEVVQATMLIAGKLNAFYMNPLGLTGFKTMNTTYQWGQFNPIDDQVKQLLDPLVFTTLSIT